MEENQNKNDKIFFITSNISKLDSKINYHLVKQKFCTNLQTILTIQQKYKMEDFIIRVYSFDIIKNEIKEINKDPKNKTYKAIIYLNYNNYNFEGEISFKKTKNCFNTFFFDLQFKDYHGFFGVTKPPQNIKFSKAEQMRIYNRALKTLKIKQGEPLFITLITDSSRHIFKQKFYLDFYLEILKACYTKKEVKSLLMMFNLNNVILPKQLDKTEYLFILNSIEKNPNLIIKHCSEKDNEEKYFKLFYTLLLFFRYNYENDKVQNLINNKDLWKYFTEILAHNSKFFPNLNISDKLINNILNQKEISYK